MEKTHVSLAGMDLPCYSLEALVVGSGCAALNAADSLAAQGVQDIALLTEGFDCGTSRNTGSDKQTYYKLSLCGEEGDSVVGLARTLLSGGGVHGDLALVEAAYSARCFLKLVEAGVPFPRNAYGEFVGYKTDHDPRGRATSAGPLTSRMMTEALGNQVRARGIPILDHMMAAQLLVFEGSVCGLLALDLTALAAPHHGWTLLRTAQIVLATGGPAALYAHRVYPESQSGMTGLALSAGAAADNLNHWQYGLSSTGFRWNVSGTYQQVLPRYVLEDGTELLPQALGSTAAALSSTFLKGYEWPFDSAKAGGSSRVDLAVARAMSQGHTVSLDFRSNPQGLAWATLDATARAYLSRSGALQDTPISRLLHMNPDAAALYADHGIDLAQQPLPIAVCAQHMNGGIAVDADWQSTLTGLYVCGEAAGTFGLYRPGGSALNATQVGSLRAAEAIARRRTPPPAAFTQAVSGCLPLLHAAQAGLNRPSGPQATAFDTAQQLRMSTVAAQHRTPAAMSTLLQEVTAQQHTLRRAACLTPQTLPAFVKALDRMESTRAVLSAMLLSADVQGSCGSALVEGRPRRDGAGEIVIHTQQAAGGYASSVLACRPLPQPDRWFETVWADFKAREERP